MRPFSLGATHQILAVSGVALVMLSLAIPKRARLSSRSLTSSWIGSICFAMVALLPLGEVPKWLLIVPACISALALGVSAPIQTIVAVSERRDISRLGAIATALCLLLLLLNYMDLERPEADTWCGVITVLCIVLLSISANPAGARCVAAVITLAVLMASTVESAWAMHPHHVSGSLSAEEVFRYGTTMFQRGILKRVPNLAVVHGLALATIGYRESSRGKLVVLLTPHVLMILGIVSLIVRFWP